MPTLPQPPSSSPTLQNPFRALNLARAKHHLQLWRQKESPQRPHDIPRRHILREPTLNPHLTQAHRPINARLPLPAPAQRDATRHISTNDEIHQRAVVAAVQYLAQLIRPPIVVADVVVPQLVKQRGIRGAAGGWRDILQMVCAELWARGGGSHAV
jgi:hypothetical protein